MISNSEFCGFFLPPKKENINHIFEKKTWEVLEKTLDDIVNDTYISKEEKFQSIFTFKIQINDVTKFELNYDDRITFSEEDKTKLIQWIINYNSDKIDEDSYLGDFFRIELKNFILLTQIYSLEDEEQILIGYLLKNNLMTRLELAECFQSFLFKKML